MDHLNDILGFAGMGMEAVIIGLLFYRRVWNTLPFFCIYTVWTLLSDTSSYIVLNHFPSRYFAVYFASEIISFLLQFCVLVEVAWSVVRPFRASLPRYTVLFLGLLVAIACGVVWFFADSPSFTGPHIPHAWHMLLRLKQTETILRVIFFLLLASCSHFLSIGWRDRELQVMTGLGFYSLAALTVTILQSHQGVGSQFRRLDQLLVATYVGSLLYWAVSFAQKEAERREFTPQMQELLLAFGGFARSSRVALTHSESDESGKRRKP